MYASFCSNNQGVLKRFVVGDDFEDAKVQLEDDCILPALHDLIDYSAPPARSDAFAQRSGRSPRSAQMKQARRRQGNCSRHLLVL